MTRLRPKTTALLLLALSSALLLPARSGDALEPEDFFSHPDLVKGDVDVVARARRFQAETKTGIAWQRNAPRALLRRCRSAPICRPSSRYGVLQ